jgi:hypothetical protein
MTTQRLAPIERRPDPADAYRDLFGPDVVISYVRGSVLVHLDHPEPEEVVSREAEFDPRDYLARSFRHCADDNVRVLFIVARSGAVEEPS